MQPGIAPLQARSGADPQDAIVGPAEVLLPGSQHVVYVLSIWLLVLGTLCVVVLLVRRRVRARRGATLRPPVGTVIAAVAATAGLVGTVLWHPPAFFVPEFPALPRLMAEDTLWYRTITDLPVDEDSEAAVATLGGQPLVPGASSSLAEGITVGIPFNLVDGSTPEHEFRFSTSQPVHDGPYPVAEPAYVQSMPGYGIDNHYIAVDAQRRLMWEIISFRRWFGRWEGGGGALWDLDDPEFPKASTTASRLPMLPGLFTYAEVEAGSVGHAMFGTAPNLATDEFVWPARGTDGVDPSATALPMGAWLRLRSDVDLGSLGPQARVIAVALQQHGLIMADTGGVFSVTGVPDARWDDADLATLRTLDASDFEVVDPSSIIVAPDSMQVLPVGTDGAG